MRNVGDAWHASNGLTRSGEDNGNHFEPSRICRVAGRNMRAGKNSIDVGRRCAIALASVGTVTILAAVPLRAQNKSIVGEAPFAPSVRLGSAVQSPAVQGSGSILSTVGDVEGDGVPAAQIILTNISTPQHYTQLSGENGEFAFTGVSPGTYFVTV